MKRLAAILLILVLTACGLSGVCAAEDVPEISGAEEAVVRLPDEMLMTFYDNTIFAGDSLIAMFRNYVKLQQKEDPGFFAGVDFRAANSYKFRFAAYKTIPSGEMKFAHLTDGGQKVTLYYIVKKEQPDRVFIMAGINDMLTTDYKNENGIERALRYVRGATELIREASPETRIYFFSQMPVTKSFVQGSHHYKEVQERWDAINEAILAECDELDITLVDAASALKDEDGVLPARLSSDGLYHLNDDGNAILVQVLMDLAQAEYEAGTWVPAQAPAKEE